MTANADFSGAGSLTTASPFATQQVFLREHLLLLLEPLPEVLRQDVQIALSAEGKLLSTSRVVTSARRPIGSWPILTLLVAQACAPGINGTTAGTVAVAIECLICSLDLLDDVEDGDQTPSLQTLGVARTLNVATALLLLAQRTLLTLAEHRDELLRHFLDETMVAVAGQHQDLKAERQELQKYTVEDCIAIARAKAGALMGLACGAGALSADASVDICAQFTELGTLLGIAHQLDNDCHDLSTSLLHTAEPLLEGNALRVVKTDNIRGITLPIVLATQYLESTLQGRGNNVDEERQVEVQAFHQGILAAWSLCLLYRERARILAQELEGQQKMTPELRLLLGLSLGIEEHSEGE